MNLATRLNSIRKAHGTHQVELVSDFWKDIDEHQEGKLLSLCLIEAIKGKGGITLPKDTLPPLSLKEEGFYLKETRCGYQYCWG